jgi:hypothetical protein
MAAINANLEATASSSHEIADQPMEGDGGGGSHSQITASVIDNVDGAASLSHEIATGGSESIDGGGGSHLQITASVIDNSECAVSLSHEIGSDSTGEDQPTEGNGSGDSHLPITALVTDNSDGAALSLQEIAASSDETEPPDDPIEVNNITPSTQQEPLTRYDLPFLIMFPQVLQGWNKDSDASTSYDIFPVTGERRRREVRDNFDWLQPVT